MCLKTEKPKNIKNVLYAEMNKFQIRIIFAQIVELN